MDIEALKLFNDALDKENYDEALTYLDATFKDSEGFYLKVKNLFLYLLGCITKLPDNYLDYTKTIYTYDIAFPIPNIDIVEAKNFVRAIMFNDFIKARNIYYENMDDIKSNEVKRAILNLLDLANVVKKNRNKVILKLLNDNCYYHLYTYVSDIVNNHPTFNNIYVLYLLLQDYLNKDYYLEENKASQDKNLSMVELVRQKRYYDLWEHFASLYDKEKENPEIMAIFTLIGKIIKEKNTITPTFEEKEENKNLDKEKFLDFLSVIQDTVEKEGFVILNPESEEINQKMVDLTYYIPTLGAYIIGNDKKQVVINLRKIPRKFYDYNHRDAKNKTYWDGKYYQYIDHTIEHFKYYVPGEDDAAKLAQSYFRVGLVKEGLNALKLTIGLKKYNEKYHTSVNILQYYMTLDYFEKRKEKEEKLTLNMRK